MAIFNSCLCLPQGNPAIVPVFHRNPKRHPDWWFGVLNVRLPLGRSRPIIDVYLKAVCWTKLSICLSIHLTIYLRLCRSFLSIDLSVYLSSTYLPIYLSTNLPIYQPAYLPIYLSAYLPIYLSVSISLSLSLSFLSLSVSVPFRQSVCLSHLSHLFHLSHLSPQTNLSKLSNISI